MKNIKTSIEIVCQRCGYINNKDMPILSTEHEAVFRCERCAWIIFIVFADEIEDT